MLSSRTQRMIRFYRIVSLVLLCATGYMMVSAGAMLMMHSTTVQPVKTDAVDSNWDGLVAGAATGYVLGQYFPVAGPPLATAAGAYVGFELDRRH